MTDGKKVIGATGGKEIELGVSEEQRAKRRAVLDKTTGKDLQKKFDEEAQEEIQAAEARVAPPTITEARCHVCTSPWRVFIEQQLVKGQSYEAIAIRVPPNPEGKKPSRKSIGGHWENHMAIDQMAIRAELEEEANLLRQNVEQGAKGALTNRGILQVIVRRAYDDFLNGRITAEVKDIVQLVKLVNEMETDTATIKNEETEAALRIFLRAIQNMCSLETQGEIQAEVKRLREMDQIEYTMENELGAKPKMIEAQVVDEETRTQSDD